MSFNGGISKSFELTNILQVSKGSASRPAAAPVEEK